MFKMILSAVVALGLGSVAYAADDAATTTTGTPNAEMPKGDAPAAADAHAGKKGHGKGAMPKGDMAKKAGKGKKKGAEETK